MSKVDMSGYIDVATRIADFRARYPDGSLQPFDPARPFDVVTVGDRTFVVVVAAAYRTPDDPRPGVGMAWEPFPGRTPYTRDSELMNAETSAWGRAIVAALAGDTRTGIASADEISNRADDRDAAATAAAAVLDMAGVAGLAGDALAADVWTRTGRDLADLTVDECRDLWRDYRQLAADREHAAEQTARQERMADETGTEQT